MVRPMVQSDSISRVPRWRHELANPRSPPWVSMVTMIESPAMSRTMTWPSGRISSATPMHTHEVPKTRSLSRS